MSQAGTLNRGIFPPGTVVETLTGNTGGAVGPNGANNINVVGGLNITTSGNPGTSTLTINATQTPLINNYTNVTTTPYVVTATDYYLSVNTGIAITIQLPNAPTQYRTFIIKDRTGNAAVNNITVTTVGGVVLIDGAASQIMNANFESLNLLFNGVGYELF